MTEQISAATGARAPAEWALVGRDAELAALVERTDPGTVGVVLLGPAGVGKSRLAREALRAAAEGGARTHWIQATSSSAAAPLGAYAGVLAGESGNDDALTNPTLPRAVAAIARDAAGRRLVLAIDDAHALDPLSAALTLELAASGAATVIVTVRTGETTPDAITSLWKDAGAARLEVGALEEPEAGALVEAIVGGPVDAATRRWAFEASGGNALYLRELMLGAQRGGVLTLADGLWRMSRRPSMSASLTELVTARLVGLSGDERLAVELLALGQPLQDDALAGATSDAALESLESRGLITADPTGAVQLTHPLYAEATVDGLGSIRRRSLQRTLVDLVGSRRPLAAVDALRVASWSLTTGQEIELDALLTAARAAVSAGDATLGSPLATRALEAGGGIEATLLLARCSVLVGRPDEAESLLAAVDEAAIDTPELAAQYVQQRGSVLVWGLGRRLEARDVSARIVALRDDPAWRRQLEPLRLLWSEAGEESAQSMGATEQALADDATAPAVREQLAPARAMQLLYVGRGREAFDAVIDLDVVIPMRTHADELTIVALTMAGGQTGENLDLSRTRARDIFDRGLRHGDAAAAGLGANALGLNALARGQYVDAARWAAESVGQFEQRDVFGSLVVAYAGQASIAAVAGDFTAASGFLERCIAARDASPATGAPPYLVFAEARVAGAGGDAARAAKLLMDGWRTFHEDAPLVGLSMLHEAMRYGEPASRAAGFVDDRVDSRLSTAYMRHVRAKAARDGAALMDAVDGFEAIGVLRHALDTAVDAAEAFVADGRTDSARRAAARANELYARCQGGAPPRIDGLGTTAVGLTSREQSIVDLVREGLSNAAIAERLVLSVRTVESHVYRASQKLGVSDRREL